MAILPLPELVLPDYNIYQYNPGMYKIIRFNSTAPRGHALVVRDKNNPKYSDKLIQSISRARRVCLELALCNDWTWFGTLTIAKNNFDRSNLDGWYKKFREWLKYQRKKYNKKIPYLLVPEQHGDGSWHMHGFFNSDIDDLLISFRSMDESGYLSPEGKKLPRNLIDHDYFNWPVYQDRFGFCSFGKIRNKDAAAFYCVKYISKSFSGDCGRVGLRLYYPSEGLNRSEQLDSIYGPCTPLDQCLRNHYEWCSTGFVSIDKEPGYDPIGDIIEENTSNLYPIQFSQENSSDPDVDDYYFYTQLGMEEFCYV